MLKGGQRRTELEWNARVTVSLSAAEILKLFSDLS